MYFWAVAQGIGKAPPYVFLGAFPQKVRATLLAALGQVSARRAAMLLVRFVK